MNIEDAINTAMEFESKVRDIYYDALQNARDSVAKRIFKVLGEEEQNHLEYLESKLDEWRKTGMITTKKLATAVPSKDAIEKGIGAVKAGMTDENLGGELQILTKAFNMETKTSNFYKKMVEELPPDGQKLFAGFVEIEEGHLALVQAEIDYFRKTGYWFDFKEFDMEGY